MRHLGNSDIGSSGLPHFSFFPYDTLEATVASPDRFDTRVGIDPSSPSPYPPSTDQLRLKVPKQTDSPDGQVAIDLRTGLQYGTAEGFPPLHAFVRRFTRDYLHPDVPYEGGPEVILTCGSTDGFFKVIELLTNPWMEDKDWIGDRQGILCEEFTYMNAIQTVLPRGLNVVPVATDVKGMKASGKGGLADVLENWDYSRGRRPHLMYTVTYVPETLVTWEMWWLSRGCDFSIGQNPTGTLMPVERRREIYALCQKYDIIIIEDEPYWNLQYRSARNKADDGQVQEPGAASSRGGTFIDHLLPSYISIDVDGRVVRLDTFSKIIAPGARLGWVTAQPAITARLTQITEVSTQQPSGFVQVMVAKLLLSQQELTVSREEPNLGSWKMDGWVRWLEGLRGSYERRMRQMCETLDEGQIVPLDYDDHHPNGWTVVHQVPMYEFNWPGAGMFVWIKIRSDTHPLVGRYGSQVVCKKLWRFLVEEPFRCLVMPGWVFAPTADVVARATEYLRLCFAPMEEPEVAALTRRFVAGCRAFWQLKSLDDIPDDDDEAAILPEMARMHLC